MQKTKIFGIGLNKTGTSTLAECCQILGFRKAPYDDELLPEVARCDYDRAFNTVSQYDVFEDWPYPLMYKVLDEQFPGNKFILTTRKSPEKWVASIQRHLQYVKPLRLNTRLAYGYYYPDGHEQDYINRYLAFNQQVRDYFAGRPDDFLEICWEDGDGWEKLCAFLGEAVPDQEFPHANKGRSYEANFKRKFINKLFAALLKNQNV